MDLRHRVPADACHRQVDGHRTLGRRHRDRADGRARGRDRAGTPRPAAHTVGRRTRGGNDHGSTRGRVRCVARSAFGASVGGARPQPCAHVVGSPTRRERDSGQRLRPLPDQLADVGDRRLVELVRSALAEAAPRPGPRRRRVRHHRAQHSPRPAGLRAHDPRPHPRPPAVGELHGLHRRGIAGTRQVDWRRTLGFLGERACGDGGAHRARDSAAAAFDRRPDRRHGVQRIQQLGAAAADAQPSRGAGIWRGRRRHHRLLDRCAAQLIPQAQSRCGVRVHEDGRLCRPAVLSGSGRHPAGERGVALPRTGGPESADPEGGGSSVWGGLREAGCGGLQRPDDLSAQRQQRHHFLSRAAVSDQPRYAGDREPGAATDCSRPADEHRQVVERGDPFVERPIQRHRGVLDRHRRRPAGSRHVVSRLAHTVHANTARLPQPCLDREDPPAGPQGGQRRGGHEPV